MIVEEERLERDAQALMHLVNDNAAKDGRLNIFATVPPGRSLFETVRMMAKPLPDRDPVEGAAEVKELFERGANLKHEFWKGKNIAQEPGVIVFSGPNAEKVAEIIRDKFHGKVAMIPDPNKVDTEGYNQAMAQWKELNERAKEGERRVKATTPGLQRGAVSATFRRQIRAAKKPLRIEMRKYETMGTLYVFEGPLATMLQRLTGGKRENFHTSEILRNLDEVLSLRQQPEVPTSAAVR